MCLYEIVIVELSFVRPVLALPVQKLVNTSSVAIPVPPINSNRMSSVSMSLLPPPPPPSADQKSSHGGLSKLWSLFGSLL